MAFSFLYLAIQAKELESTKLSVYAQKIPSNFHLNWKTDNSTVSITDIINDIAKSHNENVFILEKSIHQSAETSFWLNCLSFFFSLMGFAAQQIIYIHEKCNKKDKY